MRRMTMRSWNGYAGVVAVASLWLSLAGCGGESSSSGGDRATSPPSHEEFVAQRAAMRAEVDCRAKHEVCGGRPPVAEEGPSPEECVQETTGGWEALEDVGARFGGSPERRRALEAGTLDFDQQAAADCLAGLRSYVGQLSCTQAKRMQALILRGAFERDVVPGCAEVFEPRAGEGETCAGSMECEGELTCSARESDGVCGKCRPSDGSGGGGQDGLEFAREGELCASPNHAPTCNPTEPLVCDQSGPSEWRCVEERSKEEGETCGRNAGCAGGLVCREGSCKPFEVVGQGESCESGTTYCESPYICGVNSDGDQVCTEEGAEGDPCRRDDHCGEELFCELENFRDEVGTCEPPLENGETCDYRDKCAGDLRCIYRSREGRKCREQLGEGEECHTQGDCQEGLVCRWTGRDQECTPRQQNNTESEETTCRGSE
jgi:hypothetical protein